MKTLLDIINLKTHFDTHRGTARVLDGLNLQVHAKDIFGLVGESGSGKSVMAYSIIRLLKKPGKIVGGQIFFSGVDLLCLTEKEMQQVRGKKISMIFQNPRESLNPLIPIGKQLKMVLKARKHLSGDMAYSVALDILDSVELPDTRRLMSAYPHELSGGMCQRVMIALALACSPQFLIADEPTTGLDVTIQCEIIKLLKNLTEKKGLTQMIISHDLGLVAEICEVVAVMYLGYIVEFAPVVELFDNTQHPYTQGLLACRPKLESNDELYSIPGLIPDFVNTPLGCPFHSRCSRSKIICERSMPPAIQVGERHSVACFFPGARNG